MLRESLIGLIDGAQAIVMTLLVIEMPVLIIRLLEKRQSFQELYLELAMIFLGYLLAGMAAGRPTERCMAEAAAAAAIHVTRPGTGAAIPTRAEVDAFLKKTG